MRECKYKAFNDSGITAESYVAVRSDRESEISYVLIVNADGFREDGRIIGSEIADFIVIDKNSF